VANINFNLICAILLRHKINILVLYIRATMPNRTHIFGLLLCFAIAGLSFLAKDLFGLATTEVTALLLGLGVANFFPLGEKFAPGIQFSEKKILAWAIALLGIQMSFRNLNISLWLIPAIILAIGVSIFLGKLLAKRVGVSDNCGFFIGVGTAICGASAIAAVSPFFKSDSSQTGVSIGVVNVLGTVGMLLLPLLTVALGFSQEQAGVLIGGSLQAVGHVVGGGYAVGDEAGQIATLVKLGRVLMLGPVVIITALVMSKKNAELDQKKIIPGFIVVFLLLLILANVVNIPEEITQPIKLLDKWLLTAAMAGIGLRIKVKDLMRQGPKALLLGSIIFVVQIAVVLGYIYGQEYFT